MLDGKVVVIIGGAGLIGRCVSAAAAEAGAHVIVADRNHEAARSIAETLPHTPNSTGQHLSLEVDISHKQSLDDLIVQTLRHHTEIDAVVNLSYPRNPNYGRDFFDVEYEDFGENLSMHLGGYFLVAQRFARQFVTQKHGNIINFGSIYGTVAPRFQIYDGTKMTTPPEYVAIKAGIIQLTKYLARRLRGNGIRANIISPGGIEDNQPQSFQNAYKAFCSDKGMLQADDITGSVLFLLSDHSRFINGQNIIVDDGFAL